MIDIKQRLGFKDVFPDEIQLPIIDYLKNISRKSLLKTIGFCNTRPMPSYENFFSNPEVAMDIIGRVNKYRFDNDVQTKPEVVSAQAALKYAEAVLSNLNELLDGNTNDSPDADELNLFKAFLIINSELNGSQVFGNMNEDNFEKLVDLSIVFTFPIADLALFENDGIEFLNLLYTTFYKVEQLLAFLNSKPEYKNLKNGLIKSFSVATEEEFVKQMTYLFGKLLESKGKNGYLWKVDDADARQFLDSMVSEDIAPDEDFSHIKNSPIYKIDENVYSIVHYFFVIDKFYKSSKFKLKELYEKDEALVAVYGSFFNFFNKEFSENFLMKNILGQVFDKKYFIKKLVTEKELPGEPDYYVRHNNDVFILKIKMCSLLRGSKPLPTLSRLMRFENKVLN